MDQGTQKSSLSTDLDLHPGLPYWFCHVFQWCFLHSAATNCSGPAVSCQQGPSTHAEVMARYRSWPAVSQIWAFIVFPSTWMLLVANSTPMVLLLSRLNSLRVKRDRRLLFPTPESPINTTEREDVKATINHSHPGWNRAPRSCRPEQGPVP